MRRTMVAFVALLSLSAIAAGPRALVPQTNAVTTVSVDAALNRHPIDEGIYGVSFADAATLADLDIPINRWGGNTTSRYNWAISTANHARDFYFENIPDAAPNGGANGESADMFVALGSKSIMTIPVMGLLPTARNKDCGYSILKYAAQHCCSAHAPAPFENTDCGNGFSTVDGSALKTINNPLDVETQYTSAFQGDWVQHMVNAHGSAAAGGVKYYAIDNEPDLWDSTHFDIHPDPSTYDELWGKAQEYAPLIKTKDPSALVMGPELSGWMWYFDSAYDYEAGGHDYANHGSVYFVPWYLQQARSYEQANGTRILNILSLHWYPQGLRTVPGGPITNSEFDPNNPADEVTPATKQLRNQSTRSLWDPNYVDQSWIHDLGYENNKPRLIPLLHEWVDTYYPGTKIGLTEYNWGPDAKANVNDMSGATAQADVLGIFGREGLDLGVRWTSPAAGSAAYNAFKMYRNYDGAHSKFGDLSVSAAAADPDNVAAFAALRSSDHALTIMVVGKNFTSSTLTTINIANFVPSGPAEVRQLTAANAFAVPTTIAIGAGPSVSLTVPASTVTMLIIPGSYLDAPTGVVATATGPNSVDITWNAVPGANNYHVLRAARVSDPFVEFTATGTFSATDGGRIADTTYLYRVQASNGTISSAPSIIDPATTTLFTDDPLTAGTVVKKEHMNQLRAAVNAMHVAAGYGAATFTDVPVNTGTVIRARHIVELRTAVDQARATFGLSAGVWSDPAVVVNTTPIRAAQIIALRNSVK